MEAMTRMAVISPMTRDALSYLGATIKEARTIRRWTQTELASRTGVHRHTVRKAEQGDPTVTAGTLFELAVICGLNLVGPSNEDAATLSKQAKVRLKLVPERVRVTSIEDEDGF